MSTIEQYSAKKNMTNGIALCSVKNPATNSDSASGKSKGVLLVSASADKKKIRNNGSSGTMNQMLCWSSMMTVKLNDPVKRITVKMADVKISS